MARATAGAKRQSFNKGTATTTTATPPAGSRARAATAAAAALVTAAAIAGTPTQAGGQTFTNSPATLREEFSRLHGEIGTVLKAASDAGRELSPDETSANELRFTRMDAIQAMLGQEERLAAYEFSNGGADVELPVVHPGAAEVDGGAGQAGLPAAGQPAGVQRFMQIPSDAVIEIGETRVDRKQFTRAVNDWARSGNMDRRFATITTATNSGILLPKTVATPITPTYVNVLREAHNVLGVDPVSTASTEELDYPVLSATAGGQVAENAGAETENEPDLANSIKLICKTYQSGTCYFSNMQLAATSFDLYAATLPSLAFSKELGLESTIVAGIVADATITQIVPQATDAGFTYGNLVSLNRALPKKYDFLKVIVLSKDAYTAAEALVDSQGRPILTYVDPQRTSLKFFNGTPVLRSDFLQAMGTAGHITGFVASLLGFKLRDAGQAQVTRYTQVPAKPNQTGFNLFAYHAYGYDVNAMATLKCP